MEAEKYVISTLNSRLELPFTVRGIQIFVTPYHLNLSKNKIKFDCMSVLNSVYAGKKKLKSADRPKLSITESLTKNNTGAGKKSIRLLKYLDHKKYSILFLQKHSYFSTSESEIFNYLVDFINKA